MKRFCKFCQKDHQLPPLGQSNEEMVWENKDNRNHRKYNKVIG